MNIKRSNINDLNRLAEVFDTYRQHFKQPSELEQVKAFLKARMSNDEAIVYLVETGEEINGFVVLYPSFSSIGLSPIWILNDFYLYSGSNKRQMAKQLLDKISEDCQEAGAIRIEVTTRKENHRLHKLYKEYGFEKDYKYDYYFLQLSEDSASNMLK